jgi:hypothetical protein
VFGGQLGRLRGGLGILDGGIGQLGHHFAGIPNVIYEEYPQ